MARQLASDDFNRTDGAGLGANWGTPGGSNSLNIKGNRAVNGVVATVPAANHYTGGLWTGLDFFDQWSEATVKVMTNLSWVGVSVRQVNTERTAYVFGANPLDFGDGNRRIWKEITAARTGLATEAIAVAVDDVLRIEVEGTAIRGYVNGVLRLSTTDFSISFGFPGLYARKNSSAIDTPSLDDWSGGDFSGFTKIVGARFSIAGRGGLVA